MTKTFFPPVSLAGGTLNANHIGVFVNSTVERDKILIPFLKDGYDQREKLLHVINSRAHEEHRCACKRGGIDVARAEASLQLEIRDWDNAYVGSGFSDVNRMISQVEQKLELNRARFGRIRMASDMEGVVEKLATTHEVAEFEAKLNYLAPRYPGALVCVYDLIHHSASLIMDVLRAHPVVVISSALHANPFYAAPDKLMEELHSRKFKS